MNAQRRDGDIAVATDTGRDDDDVLFELQDLSVVVPRRVRDIHAVRHVDLRMARGERIAVLGESGSGKSMTVMSLLGLQAPEAVVRGRVCFEGTDVDLADPQAVERTILPRASIVFQDSLSSLNPTQRIGTQLREVLQLRDWSRRDARAEAERVLRVVGVPDARARLRSYPHELSGGMRQRVMIAIAILARPSLFVADEPTTALDTTVQAQVIDLIMRLQEETGMGLILITHDIALAAEVCQRAVVMYGGMVVEDVPMAELLVEPSHPYTRALIHAMPTLDVFRGDPLQTIAGEPPSPQTRFSACPFMPRCVEAEAQCADGVPGLHRLRAGHLVRCRLREGEGSS